MFYECVQKRPSSLLAAAMPGKYSGVLALGTCDYVGGQSWGFSDRLDIDC